MSKRYLIRQETRTNTHAYATLNGVNLLTQYSMELLSFDTGTPAPIIKLIDVPGRPGKLDATLALTGKVNYKPRLVTATFHVRDITYDNWLTLLSTLRQLYQGIESKLVFSSDPGWYYKGRFTITAEKKNPVTGMIVLKCEEAFPYKLEEVTVEDVISYSKYINCIGKDYNGTVTIYSSSASLSVSFRGTTHALAVGNNVIPEIHLSNGNNSLYFSGGSANVRITYERGIL